jgi:DNA polymerase elongation subunit (family B)
MINNIEYFFDDVESCECVGEFVDEYVYDIEVDDETHTFIADNILVHNSLYFTYVPIMESCGYKGDGLEFILNIDKLFVKKLFNEWLELYSAKFGVKNLHDFELETIQKSALHIKKKHYINNVVWEDGIFFDNLSNLIPKGVEIVRRGSPPFIRGAHGEPQMEGIWKFIRYLFKDPDNVSIKDILKLLKELKREFIVAPIEDISMSVSLSNYNQKCIDDNKTVDCVKGAHFSVKAAALHNYLLNKNPEYKVKYDLLRGGNVKWYFCKHPLNDRFAYMRSFHPDEIVQKEKVEIDYDTLYEVSMLNIVNRFLEPIGLPHVSKRLSVLTSLFSGTQKLTPTVKDDEDPEIDFWDM